MAYWKTKVEGYNELTQELTDLSVELRKKILGQAVAAATRPILKLAQGVVRRRHGVLYRALGVRVVKYEKAAVGLVGIRKMPLEYQGKKIDPRYYAHLIEFGATRRGVRGHGRKSSTVLYQRGFIARPFLRPAFEQGKTVAEEAMLKRIRAGIIRESGKANQ